MTNLLLRFVLVNFILAGVLFVQGYWYWLINFELAALSSALVIFGSFHGYRQMIQRRLDVGESAEDSLMQKLEDPYDLYDEDEQALVKENPEEDLLSVVKEEKKRLKKDKQTLKKTVKSASGILSPLRFIPYAVLILSFIGLNNNHILDIPAFLVGLSVGIISAVLLGKKWLSLSASNKRDV
ncbi:hypothetical protein JHD50_06775 [Sulfurimonas sp. MAG313]|nr:hypothetical protein [Sulfurimonas sp. MAG313]MDF1881009.1 hypothetical protein [Sulfurimonas sp. MAG313]